MNVVIIYSHKLLLIITIKQELYFLLCKLLQTFLCSDLSLSKVVSKSFICVSLFFFVCLLQLCIHSGSMCSTLGAVGGIIMGVSAANAGQAPDG